MLDINIVNVNDIPVSITRERQSSFEHNSDNMATTFEIFQYAATTMGTMGFAALTQVFRFNVTEVPAVVLEWIAAHPGQTGLFVVNGVLFFTPAALTGPLLATMGFGATGPVAGEFFQGCRS